MCVVHAPSPFPWLAILLSEGYNVYPSDSRMASHGEVWVLRLAPPQPEEEKKYHVTIRKAHDNIIIIYTFFITKGRCPVRVYSAGLMFCKNK
jgi:hypothetical protein